MVEYCQKNHELPRQSYKVTINGTTLNVGRWLNGEKQRFKSNGKGAAHSDIQLEKLMAIKEFREWAEDPLKDDDVRWEAYYQALFQYCQVHHELPRQSYKATINGTTLNVGSWLNDEQNRFKGKGTRAPHSDFQLEKLMAIKEFREWATDPWTHMSSEEQWDTMFQALVEYFQVHDELPPRSSKDPETRKLYTWLIGQKSRFSGTARSNATGKRLDLTLIRLGKLLTIEEYSKWAEENFKKLNPERRSELMAREEFRKWYEKRVISDNQKEAVKSPASPIKKKASKERGEKETETAKKSPACSIKTKTSKKTIKKVGEQVLNVSSSQVN